ncbi:hypothetical protein Tco_0255517 [Tanacetum coccineum]
MVQNVQGRQSQGYAGNARNNQALGARVINAVGNTRTNQPRLTFGRRETDDCEGSPVTATTNFKAGRVDAYDSAMEDEALNKLQSS